GPAQLHIAIFFFLPHNLIQVAEGQYGQSQLSVLLLDPEEQTPQSGDLPPIYEDLQQTLQADAPVETLEQRVDVGQDHADPCGFILIIDEESQVRVPDFHHVLSHLQCLIVTQGRSPSCRTSSRCISP